MNFKQNKLQIPDSKGSDELQDSINIRAGVDDSSLPTENTKMQMLDARKN